MFVGHYGPAFASKAARESIPLWVVFIAVQLIDVLWAIFVPLGIEKVRIVPGFTATNPLDLYYMPYTHSLIGAALWAIAACMIYYLFRKVDGWSAAAIVGAAVFSHWVWMSGEQYREVREKLLNQGCEIVDDSGKPIDRPLNPRAE